MGQGAVLNGHGTRSTMKEAVDTSILLANIGVIAYQRSPFTRAALVLDEHNRSMSSTVISFINALAGR